MDGNADNVLKLNADLIQLQILLERLSQNASSMLDGESFLDVEKCSIDKDIFLSFYVKHLLNLIHIESKRKTGMRPVYTVHSVISSTRRPHNVACSVILHAWD